MNEPDKKRLLDLFGKLRARDAGTLNHEPAVWQEFESLVLEAASGQKPEQVTDVSNSDTGGYTQWAANEEAPPLQLIEANIAERIAVSAGSLEIVTPKGAHTLAGGVTVKLDGKELKHIRRLSLSGGVREAWHLQVELFPTLG